jgi:simple sugar transport system substrate-binding protein
MSRKEKKAAQTGDIRRHWRLMIATMAAAGLLLTACLSQSAMQAPKTDDAVDEFVTVVKINGIAWFNRMEEGVSEWGRENKVNAFLTGPVQADPNLQAQIIDKQIAQKVDAINVVPVDPTVLDPVLKKAMDSGIVVITHEASNQKNMHWDIEAFDNAEFGAHLMDALAKSMGEKGEYAVFVSTLGSQTHNEWVNAGIARQKAKYPGMKLIGDKIETRDDLDIAYQRMKELIKAYPNLRGIQTSASTTSAGAARAIEEAGLSGKIKVVGTGLPSITGKYLKSGSVEMISFWDPKLAGITMNKLAAMQKKGEKIGNGLNLGLKGYEKLTAKGRVLYGNAWVDLTKNNLDAYPYF